ncbi:MAG: bifunctional ADP-dependent NAD(P)H-hydrate dehydratase/NAD(P)H-hydrate epimerase [Betaproteobacteria bacterium]|nr:bifunctional ADP-dependent NAD(P)H-hydrate dehydratase/NAD(P)H-hydrate epimerase [Betaproteobacteria bacterium]
MATAVPRPTGPSSFTAPWPLFGVQACRTIEAQALAVHPHMTLMNRAGRAVASLAVALARPPGCPVLVLTGAGHNGGDGWVAARHLHAAGWPLRVWEVQAARAPDAQRARRDALASGVVVLHEPPWPTPSGRERLAPVLQQHGLLIVDALLGLGAREPLPVEICKAIEWVAHAVDASPSTLVLSVDLPSGLQADTGTRLKDALGQPWTVPAHHTLSLLTLKPGLYTHEGRETAGQVWFDPLGTTPARPGGTPPPVQAHLVPSSLLDLLRASRIRKGGAPRHGGHKGAHGDVWLLGGAPGMTGALRLAARAAVAAGGGRVHRVELEGQGPAGVQGVCAPGEEFIAAVDDLAPEVMTRALPALRQALAAQPVVVAGCGGGPRMAQALPELLHRAPRLVLDADALNAIAGDGTLWSRLEARRLRGMTTVLTPHPLEAARLLGCNTAQVQGDRVAAAQTLAQRSGATVVLKGAGSIVATSGCVPWINGSGNERLATAGTGDVLAGWIGGAWASQAGVGGIGSPAALHDLVAACVHLHGLAADRVDTATGQCETAVLPASALIGDMARELMRAAHGHQR